jgi:hypothetical protein
MEQKGSDRRFWNNQQKEFRNLLLSFERHDEVIQRFLSQHAMLHSRLVVKTKEIDPEMRFFEDELLDDMAEDQIRWLPENQEHSIAWNIWHIGRIEDVTMNILVSGGSQVLAQDDWLGRMNITYRHTGNLMDEAEVSELSKAIDIEALRAYRLAVGSQTREIVRGLRPEELKQKVDAARLQRLLDEGAVVEEAGDLIAYWGRRNIAGLLLMPATRHNFVHLNECFRLKQRLQ